MPIEDLLVAGPERSRTHVKLRLLSAGVKENRCEECGISEWLEEPLTMTLHHVNGDGDDNRLENLMLLCPNCHSQTANFARRSDALLREARKGAPSDKTGKRPLTGRTRSSGEARNGA